MRGNRVRAILLLQHRRKSRSCKHELPFCQQPSVLKIVLRIHISSALLDSSLGFAFVLPLLDVYHSVILSKDARSEQWMIKSIGDLLNQGDTALYLRNLKGLSLIEPNIDTLHRPWLHYINSSNRAKEVGQDPTSHRRIWSQ